MISEKNLLTCRTRKRVLDDMEATAAEAEDAQMEKLRAKAVQEVISSEKSYLRHLEIIEEYFMRPLEDSPSILSRKDFVRVFGDLAPILQVLTIASQRFAFPPNEYRILKSNRWRFWPQLLSFCSSGEQGC